MLDFQYPSLEDREWLQPLLSASGEMSSTAAFGTFYIWKNTYFAQVCRLPDYTLFFTNGENKAYGPPFTAGDKKVEAVELMIADAKEKGIPFRMWGISKEFTEELEQKFPGRFRFQPDRDSFDYIYSAVDLIQLPGRKYHGKRNHVAQFQRKYNWSYEDISAENLEDCRAIAREWCKSHGCRDHSGFESEPCALRRTLDHFEELHMGGGMIRVDGKPAAFTIGEEINKDVYLLHFEKALDGYDGLYAVINQEHAARRLSSYQYINREEDMGIEGLRKAKLSYHPTVLLEKYIAWLSSEDQAAVK